MAVKRSRLSRLYLHKTRALPAGPEAVDWSDGELGPPDQSAWNDNGLGSDQSETVPNTKSQ